MEIKAPTKITCIRKCMCTGCRCTCVIYLCSLPVLNLVESCSLELDYRASNDRVHGQSRAPEAVWQVWRPPYQSKIWYGVAIPIKSKEANLFIICNKSRIKTSAFLYVSEPWVWAVTDVAKIQSTGTGLKYYISMANTVNRFNVLFNTPCNTKSSPMLSLLLYCLLNFNTITTILLGQSSSQNSHCDCKISKTRKQKLC